MRRLCLLALGLLGLPSRSEACDCPMPSIEVLPRLGSASPVNSRVWITFPAGHDPDETYALTVRARRGEPVDVERQQLGLGDARVVVLTPKARLSPETRYEVVLAVAGGRPSVIGEFRTGAAEDTSAPTWEGLTASRFVQPPRTCCNCSTGDPYAVLVPGKPADDTTATPQLLYAIWASDAKGKIDYDAPPLTYVRAAGDRVLLGHPSRCQAANFNFQTPAKKMRLGVKIVDLAGNTGEHVAVTLDLARPAEK